MVNKQGCNRREDQGSALLTVIFIIILFMILSGVFFFILSYRAKIASSEENTMKAYYLAQAAVNHGASELITNRGIPNPGTSTVQDPFGWSYGGRYSISYTNNGNRYYTVSGIGQYPEGSNAVTRIIEAQYYIGPGLSSDVEQIFVQQGGGNRAFVLSNTRTWYPLTSGHGAPLPPINFGSYEMTIFTCNNGRNQTDDTATNVNLKLLKTDPVTQLQSIVPLTLTDTDQPNNVSIINGYIHIDSFSSSITIPISGVGNQNELLQWVVTGNIKGDVAETRTGTFTNTITTKMIWQKEGN